jgi:hypothetical protein
VIGAAIRKDGRIMKRWLRRTLRRYGVDLTFTDVICTGHVKSIAVAADGRTEVAVRRSLVFLVPPLLGDLRDVVPIDPDGDLNGVAVTSPDSTEVGRVRCKAGMQVYWAPKEPIVPYALYTHEYRWSSPGWYAEAAMYTELRCETRTGLMQLEFATSGPIETAIAFKRPRWRRMTTERGLVKHALTGSESHQHATVSEDGCLATWRVAGPQIGDRYVGVVFGQNGVEQWQKRLEATSLAARMRRLFDPLIPA